jgi:hypothetical protein
LSKGINTYEFVKADSEHTDDLVERVCMTGPYRAAVANNELGLHHRDFLARFLVLRRIEHSHVLIDSTRYDRVIGGLICGPLYDFEPTGWSMCSWDSIRGLHAPFKTLKIPETCFIDALDVVQDMPGKGLGKELFLARESIIVRHSLPPRPATPSKPTLLPAARNQSRTLRSLSASRRGALQQSQSGFISARCATTMGEAHLRGVAPGYR